MDIEYIQQLSEIYAIMTDAASRSYGVGKADWNFEDARSDLGKLLKLELSAAYQKASEAKPATNTEAPIPF